MRSLYHPGDAVKFINVHGNTKTTYDGIIKAVQEIDEYLCKDIVYTVECCNQVFLITQEGIIGHEGEENG